MVQIESAQDRARSRSPPPVTICGKQLRTIPLHPHFGARITDIDIATVDDATIEQVLAPALERHGLLLFPGQHHLTPEQQFNFVCKFPDIDIDDVKKQQSPFMKADPSCLPEFPGVRALGNVLDDRLRRGAVPEENKIGMEWHTDGVGITGLFAAQVPDGGSPPRRTTLWASGYRAWDVLDEALRLKALNMRARFGPRYTVEDSVGVMYRLGARMSSNGLRRVQDIKAESLTEEQRILRESPSPNPRRWDHYCGSPIRRNPFTKRHVIWTLPMHLESCEDLELDAALKLLEDVMLPGTNKEEVYRHEWSTGDFVIWDNRCMLHSTTELVDGPQLMYQCFVRTKAPMLPATVLSL